MPQDADAAARALRDRPPSAKRIMPLAERVLTGDILLPSFQRGFVWNPKQMLDLLDSLSLNYPIGSLLLWQSRQELRSVRNIADLDVGTARPDYPVNYLLDGQQRLSTICGALNWTPGEPNSIWNIGYDLRDQKFLHFESIDDHPPYQIAVRWLTNPSNFFTRLIALDDELQARGRELFDRFTDYLIPTVTLGDMAIEDVAKVFERINSLGTRLTIVDLMRAATWSPTFDLVDAIDQVRKQLEPKRFNGVDEKSVLRIISAAAGMGFTASDIDDLRNVEEPNLKASVNTATEAAKRSADFLATQIGVPSSNALPYVNQFTVLTEVFRQIPHPTEDQFAAIRRWFWETTLSSYFGGWNTGQMNADRDAVTDFAQGKAQGIEFTGAIPGRTVWSSKDFRSNSAVSKMLGIFLAHEQPVDLLTGQTIDPGKSLSWGNDKEYHHFFPRDYLKGNDVSPRRANAIANIIMLTSRSNIQISNRAPSDYLGQLQGTIGRDQMVERLRKCLIPETAFDLAMADDYEGFLGARAEFLQAKATELTVSGTSADVPLPATFDDTDLDSID